MQNPSGSKRMSSRFTSSPESFEYPDEPVVISIEEAARLSGISRQSAYEAARRGEIPSVRIGRRILVPRNKLLRLLNGDS